MKRETYFKIVFFSILFLFTASLLELVSYLSLSESEKKLPASQFFSHQHNDFIEGLAQRTGCSFPQATVGHSMLGFVHRKAEFSATDCHLVSNNIGMDTPLDLPLKKNEGEFSIMILGGSVAHQFSIYKLHKDENYLAALLNKQYYPPDNKKVFRVYTGSLGAWAMPNQINMLTMYSERIDAAIAIDGYNESFAVGAGMRHEHIPAPHAILSHVSVDDFKFRYLNTLWSYRQFVSGNFLKHTYFANALYKVGVGLFQSYVIDKKSFDELTRGNSEDLKLPLEKAKEWSLNSLEAYSRKFHLYGRALNIKTAQFLQPTRLYGKVLTPDESFYLEFIDLRTYKKINEFYIKLNKENFPVYDLTNIFIKEKERIYSDNIHFMNVNGHSKGNEILAQNIVEIIAKTWGLKKRL